MNSLRTAPTFVKGLDLRWKSSFLLKCSPSQNQMSCISHVLPWSFWIMQLQTLWYRVILLGEHTRAFTEILVSDKLPNLSAFFLLNLMHILWFRKIKSLLYGTLTVHCIGKGTCEGQSYSFPLFQSERFPLRWRNHPHRNQLSSLKE